MSFGIEFQCSYVLILKLHAQIPRDKSTIGTKPGQLASIRAICKLRSVPEMQKLKQATVKTQTRILPKTRGSNKHDISSPCLAPRAPSTKAPTFSGCGKHAAAKASLSPPLAPAFTPCFSFECAASYIEESRTVQAAAGSWVGRLEVVCHASQCSCSIYHARYTLLWRASRGTLPVPYFLSDFFLGDLRCGFSARQTRRSALHCGLWGPRLFVPVLTDRSLALTHTPNKLWISRLGCMERVRSKAWRFLNSSRGVIEGRPFRSTTLFRTSSRQGSFIHCDEVREVLLLKRQEAALSTTVQLAQTAAPGLREYSSKSFAAC